MGDVFEEQGRMSKRDVIKQNEMLMDLAHVTDMWYDGQPILSRQQTHSYEFRDASEPRAVRLNEMHCRASHEIPKDDAVGDMFTQCQAHWTDAIR